MRHGILMRSLTGTRRYFGELRNSKNGVRPNAAGSLVACVAFLLGASVGWVTNWLVGGLLITHYT